MKISITRAIVDLSSSRLTVYAVSFLRVQEKIGSSWKAFSFFNRNCLHNVIMMSTYNMFSKMKLEDNLNCKLKSYYYVFVII